MPADKVLVLKNNPVKETVKNRAGPLPRKTLLSLACLQLKSSRKPKMARPFAQCWRQSGQKDNALTNRSLLNKIVYVCHVDVYVLRCYYDCVVI